MTPVVPPDVEQLVYSIIIATLIVSAVALIPALILAVWVVWRIRRIDLPPDADFTTALKATPLVVVVMLDLLDLSLNFMSAPVGWLILTRLGLHPLRGITVVEGFLPGTEALPTMTLAWIAVRVFRIKL